MWAAGHIITPLLLLVIAALLAYALAPAVGLLQRFMPRLLSILLVYLIVLTALSVLLYLITRAAVEQTFSLSHYVQDLLRPGTVGRPSTVELLLAPYGITASQIASTREAIVGQAQGLARDVVPIVRSVFDAALNVILVAVLSIYMLIDGSRIASWIRRNAPRALRADFLLDTLQRVVGGYIRGQCTLAVLIGTLVGIGMFLLHVPYAVFLGVLAFIMAFVPILGTLLSGAVCVLIALTQGWLTAAAALVYFVILHVIESDLVGPRIVGKAIGLHPIVSLFALLAGAQLFGIWGALFASPIAGVLQALIVTIWTEWRKTHPEEFRRAEEHVVEKVEAAEEHSVAIAEKSPD
jgi:predicted PurR-regulated permease PerM